MKKIFFLFLAVLFAFTGCVDGNNCGETDAGKLSKQQNDLMKTHPEYFGLNASNGLDVIVWHMSPDYEFGLLEHSDKARNWVSEELMGLRGVDAEKMKTILSTYHIKAEDIYIVPWQNPISSYLPEWCIRLEGEDEEARKDRERAYIEKIRELLFSDMDSSAE